MIGPRTLPVVPGLYRTGATTSRPDGTAAGGRGYREMVAILEKAGAR